MSRAARARDGWATEEARAPAKVAVAQALYADHTHSIAAICTSLGVSRATLYHYLDTPATTDAEPAER